jgi:AGZA family xanthine/uracil permease-like MFS transporter
VLIIALDQFKVPGAVIIGVLAVTAASIAVGRSKFGGVVGTPPSPARCSSQMDLAGALKVGLVTVVFAFCSSTCSTTPAPDRAAHRGGFMRKTAPCRGCAAR